MLKESVNMYNRPRRSFAPIREGEELDVKIESVGKKGDGIAKKDNFVIIVSRAEMDKEYKVKIVKVFPNMAFSEIM